MISIDVTSSSDDEESISPCNAEAAPKRQLSCLSSPITCGRGLMSDSSDSDVAVVTQIRQSSPKPKKVNPVETENRTFSDSDVDLYEVDYNFHHQQALKSANKEIKALNEIMYANSCETIVSNVSEDQDQEKDDCLIEADSENIQQSPLSPTLLDLKKLPKRRRIKRDRKTKKYISRLKALSREIAMKTSIDDNLNLSVGNDAVILSDDEVDNVINLRVKWGSDYLRMPFRTFQKFSHLYQELAQRFSVNVSQVVLSHKDKVISSGQCPRDLGLSIADIIEGGIESKASCDRVEAVGEKNPDSVCLKVQNADRKGMLNINISRYDKMSVLMHKYAKEKNVNLEKLKFLFDGEILDPNETPVDLDLDGGECIDVYHI